MKQLCNKCGQSVSNVRHGIRLTPLKARIFDAIANAGVGGIATCDLFDVVFANDSRRHSVRTLKAHIWQLNQRLLGTGLHIYGRRGAYLFPARSGKTAGNAGISMER